MLVVSTMMQTPGTREPLWRVCFLSGIAAGRRVKSRAKSRKMTFTKRPLVWSST